MANPNVPLSMRWGGTSSGAPMKADESVPRNQTFRMVNGYPMETPLRRKSLSHSESTPTFGTSGKMSSSPAYYAKFRQAQDRANRSTPLPFAPESPLPKFISEDRKVLRFYAYFKEAVNESGAMAAFEKFRVRKCVIYVYLEDDTWRIAEPKVENSGMPQGSFVKRHKIPRAGGGFYVVGDLEIGGEVSIYGRSFRVVDCDRNTRDYMMGVLGRDMGAPENYPGDTYSSNRAQHMKMETGADTTIPRGSKMSPMKKFMEARMGKFYSSQSLASYLQNDRKVLRFHCVWDDRQHLYGGVNKFTIHYFLTDDTVEILEDKQTVGKDPFPLLLHRNRLPRNYLSLPDTGVVESPAHMFYSHADFKIGALIDVYNRKLMVIACDMFTRQWYNENYGENYIGSDINLPKINKKIPRTEPPPHNGIGSEEDSLGSCQSLRPQPPKKDIAKLIAFDKKMLKWGAHMDSTRPEDKGRRFVITLYLANDTLSIFEVRGRNTGIMAGKFLERGPYKNVEGKKYDVTNFEVGRPVVINSHTFIIDDMDKNTSSWITSKTMRNEANMPELISKLRTKLKSQSRELAKTFRSVDIDKNGYLTFSEMKKLLREYFADAELTPLEVVTIMKYFDPDRSGKIDYREFARMVLPDGQHVTSSGAYMGDHAHDGALAAPSPTAAGDNYFDNIMNEDDEATRQQELEECIQGFTEAFVSKKKQLAQTFRLFDHDGSGKLNKEEFKTALSVGGGINAANFNLTERQIELLVDHYFDDDTDKDGDGEVDYDEFMTQLWEDYAGESSERLG